MDPADNSNAMITFTVVSFSWYLMTFHVTCSVSNLVCYISTHICCVSHYDCYDYYNLFINVLNFYHKSGRYSSLCTLPTSVLFCIVSVNDQISINLFLNCISERYETYMGKII